MKESTKEDLANHFGLELYADGGNVMGVVTSVSPMDSRARATRLHPVPVSEVPTAILAHASGYHSLSDGERIFRGAKGDDDKFTT